MMIVMKETATEEEVEAVVEKIERAGALAHRIVGARVTVIGAIGDVEQDVSVEGLGLEGQPGVDRVVPILKPYKLASAQITHGERSVLDIGGRKVGGDNFALIAGPCTVESREQMLQTARVVHDAGATLLRGGAYKPRTSPYAFQGLGQEGLRLLAEAKAETGLPIVTELMDMRDIDAVLEVADVVQIGARNMQNYPLLAEIGRSGRPALLKRGLSSTLDELLMAAEYILKEGNPQRDALRARHPHVRDRLPLHARPDGGAGAQGALAPAGDRRPEPRGRAARARACRCRWRPPRSAPTGSSSRSTRTPTRRSATVRRRCARRTSPSSRRRSSRRRRSRARRSAPSDRPRGLVERNRARGRADRRLDRPGRPAPRGRARLRL